MLLNLTGNQIAFAIFVLLAMYIGNALRKITYTPLAAFQRAVLIVTQAMKHGELMTNGLPKVDLQYIDELVKLKLIELATEEHDHNNIPLHGEECNLCCRTFMRATPLGKAMYELYLAMPPVEAGPFRTPELIGQLKQQLQALPTLLRRITSEDITALSQAIQGEQQRRTPRIPNSIEIPVIRIPRGGRDT